MIEIKGTQFHNKGAELMLLSILDYFRSQRSNIQFAIAPNYHNCMYEHYANLGLQQKLWLRHKGIQWGNAGFLIPEKIRKMYGIVLNNEIDAILDTSGFAYSSQWGIEPTKRMASYTKKWKKEGKKVILMPQAFGPFEDKQIKRFMQIITEYCDLIYAREEDSYKHLISITGEKANIKISPDFTILLEGKSPDYFDANIHQVCIVPNMRMVDKLSDQKDKYVNFMVKTVKAIKSYNLNPFFLIHGGNEDLSLAKQIQKSLKESIPIINESNPLLIKGIIKCSKGLIGSRFHSLASGLYSSVPTLGTGWSHKYNMLFKDFQFSEGLIDIEISSTELNNKLKYITAQDFSDNLSLSLTECSKKQKSKVLKMFMEIEQVLGI